MMERHKQRKVKENESNSQRPGLVVNPALSTKVGREFTENDLSKLARGVPTFRAGAKPRTLLRFRLLEPRLAPPRFTPVDAPVQRTDMSSVQRNEGSTEKAEDSDRL